MYHSISESQSYTTTNSGSSLASSLYSTASIDLLENAQYIFSLHEKSLQPLSNSEENPRTSKEKEDEQHEIIVRELGRNVFGVPMEWARTLYHDVARDDEIKAFVDSEIADFDTDRNIWTGIPSGPADASEVREPIVKIVSAILGHFYPSLPDGMGRGVVDSHDEQLVHDNGKHYSQPAIAIQAKGPSFEVPEHADGPDALGFTNIAAVIEIRLDEAKGSRRQQAEQLAVYCRQMFLQQPNRHFSRSLMVTEKQFRLVHYDRSGVYVTPFFDIHQDKEIFIHFVLGLSSLNEAELGLDTSVQWTIDAASGKKVAGTIKVDECGAEGKVVRSMVYSLNMDEPPFVRPGIRGRGTTAWRATHPTTGEGFFIKDAWRTSSRSAECAYLLAARGIPGVIQLVGYQDYCAETIKYRPSDFKAPHFENRIKLRVVLKRYGSCITQFTSRLALFCAFRDAIVGHRKLLDKGVLHRDISVQNILFGSAGAGEGERGILIDLDLAVWAENGVSPVAADPRVGTRQYQSVAVCRSHVQDLPEPQTYLDDLESFFFILVHIMYTFQKPRTVCMPQPPFLDFWGSDNAKQSGDQKSGFTLDPIRSSDIAAFWGKPCKALLKQFHAVIEGLLRKKIDIRWDEDTTDDQKLKAHRELAGQYDVYFQQVVSAFDTAIDSLKKEGLNADEIAAIARYPAHTFPSHSAPRPVVPAAPYNVPSSATVTGSVIIPASEKAAGVDALTKDASSGTSKKRASDDEPRDNTPRKRHRNAYGTISPPPPARSPKAKTSTSPRSNRAFAEPPTKRRHSPSPAS